MDSSQLDVTILGSTLFEHRQLLSDVERMQIILDHFYQHLASDVGFTVSFPPVFIEIPKPGAP